MISSVVSFANMAIANPALLNVGPLAALGPAITRYRAELKSPGCGCKKNASLKEAKGLFEASMSTLSELDRQQLKSTLKADQICYYVVNSHNVLEMKCF